MQSRDLVGIVLSQRDDEPVFAALEELSGDASVATAVLLNLLPDPAYTADGVLVSAVWEELLGQARSDFRKESKRAEARCGEPAIPLDFRAMECVASLAGAEAALRARHYDLCVLLRPNAARRDLDRNAIFEQVLFGSGRPVLLIPPGWRRRPMGRHIAVGWNGKREAARALADAAPFLDKAERVTVITIDAQPSPDGLGQAPGMDITEHLARKQIKAVLRNADGLGRPEGEALLAEAKAVGADFLVVGGYGKPRLREFVFGGVTRTLTETADLPLLLSH